MARQPPGIERVHVNRDRKAIDGIAQNRQIEQVGLSAPFAFSLLGRVTGKAIDDAALDFRILQICNAVMTERMKSTICLARVDAYQLDAETVDHTADAFSDRVGI